MISNIRKKKNIQSEQKEDTRIQKNEDRLRSLWDNSNRSNIHIIWVPGGEEKEQKIANLFEKIMKENLLNGEGDRHASPGSTEDPNQVEPKEDHTKTHHN